MAHRPDKAEFMDRVSAVFLMLSNGQSSEKIVQYAAGSPWNVGKSTAYKYIRAANKLFAENAAHDRETMVGMAKVPLNDLFERAMQAGDLKTALAVQKELNALLDLYPAAKIEHSGKIDFVTACLEADRIFTAGGSGEAVDGS